MKTATLNIGTLIGKSIEITDMITRRRIGILCLKETRWTGGKSGDKARNLGNGVKLYYSGGGKPRNGVEICLKEEWQDKTIEINRKLDRIMLMKLVKSSKMYSIITAYAPQQGCEDEEKEKYWNELAEVTDNIKQAEEIVLAVDLNGHVGAEREEYKRWHGGKTLGQRNEKRKMKLDMVRASNLALVNTFFT